MKKHIICVVVMIFIFGCSKEPSYFVIEYNTTREKIGLSSLPLDWVYSPPCKGGEIGGWRRPDILLSESDCASGAFRWSKNYRVRNDTILF